jgi:hypothetical protein
MFNASELPIHTCANIAQTGDCVYLAGYGTWKQFFDLAYTYWYARNIGVGYP